MHQLTTVSRYLGPVTRLSAGLLFFISTSELFGQKAYEEIVTDKSTNEAIGYVNIGIVNKNIGTVSDSEGKFKISLSEQNDNDSLRLSIVGYKSRQFKVSDFKTMICNDREIKLEEEITKLSE